MAHCEIAPRRFFLAAGGGGGGIAMVYNCTTENSVKRQVIVVRCRQCTSQKLRPSSSEKIWREGYPFIDRWNDGECEEHSITPLGVLWLHCCQNSVTALGVLWLHRCQKRGQGLVMCSAIRLFLSCPTPDLPSARVAWRHCLALQCLFCFVCGRCCCFLMTWPPVPRNLPSHKKYEGWRHLRIKLILCGP
jgi:hypothetical protein